MIGERVMKIAVVALVALGMATAGPILAQPVTTPNPSNSEFTFDPEFLQTVREALAKPFEGSELKAFRDRIKKATDWGDKNPDRWKKDVLASDDRLKAILQLPVWESDDEKRMIRNGFLRLQFAAAIVTRNDELSDSLKEAEKRFESLLREIKPTNTVIDNFAQKSRASIERSKKEIEDTAGTLGALFE